ncbi:hypothetical protein ACRAWD_04220 [Caulobacter segnis]
MAWRELIVPTVEGMAAEGNPYVGVLAHAGLMLTLTGPKLVEYNARFGDPECQDPDAALESDIVPILLAAAKGELASAEPPKWRGRGGDLRGAGRRGPSRRPRRPAAGSRAPTPISATRRWSSTPVRPASSRGGWWPRRRVLETPSPGRDPARGPRRGLCRAGD